MKLLYKLALAATLSLTTLAATQATDNSVFCLAKNIYHEARGEPLAGKLAVAKVTLNRVKSPQFANTVCDVVYQRWQFSWTHDKTLRVVDKRAWAEAVNLAKLAIETELEHVKLNALYFHNTSIKPKWNRVKIAKIGNHVFYK